ncbi:MAG: peptide MFS transporter [Alphaproteobacteria bacterium]|nr:peptide MFS transporter [Alphaproteobacteria bacterium]
MARLLVKQPEGFWGIILAELWERFSFYGLRSFLVLFMTHRLLYTDDLALRTYATFMALIYLAPLIGGYLADRFLGKKISVAIGIFHMIICYNILFFLDSQYFNLGLAFLVLGTGYFKSNIVSMVGSQFTSNDPRRDSGFTYFYTAVNLGALLAPLCGFFAQKPDLIFKIINRLSGNTSPISAGSTPYWEVGFFIAGLVILISFVVFIFFGNKAKIAENELVIATPTWLKSTISILTLAFVIPIYFIIQNHSLMDVIVISAGIISVVYWIVISLRCPIYQKNALLVCLGLMLCNMCFMAILEQGGGSIALFIERNINKEIFGLTIPSSVFQGINPLFVTLMGPMFAILWNRLSLKGKNIGAPMQFGLSLAQIGIALLILSLGCFLSKSTGIVPLGWLLLSSFFISSGELFISPIGLSLITRIAPTKYTSAMSAIWFLSYAFANYIGGTFAQLFMSVPSNGSSPIEPKTSILVYSNAFNTMGLTALLFGLVTMLAASRLNKTLQKNAEQTH